MAESQSPQVGFSEVIKIFSGCREVSADSRAAAAQIKILLFCAVFRECNKAFPLMQMAEKNHTRRSRENAVSSLGAGGRPPVLSNRNRI